MVERPRRWNIRFIKNFMITFGLISSIFDYLTFGILLFLLKASPAQFRTGWFIESVISAALIVLVIRTRQPFFKSKPGKALTLATLFVTIATLLIPYTPLGELFGFEVLPFYFIPLMAVIVGMYIFTAEGGQKDLLPEISVLIDSDSGTHCGVIKGSHKNVNRPHLRPFPPGEKQLINFLPLDENTEVGVVTCRDYSETVNINEGEHLIHK